MTVNQFLKKFNLIALVFTSLYLSDSVLPSLKHEGVINDYHAPLVSGGKYSNPHPSRDEIIIDTSAGRIKTRLTNNGPIHVGDSIILYKSPILQTARQIKYLKKDRSVRSGNILFSIMTILPLVVIGVALFSVFTKNMSALHNIGSTNVILFLLFLYLFIKDYLR